MEELKIYEVAPAVEQALSLIEVDEETGELIIPEEAREIISKGSDKVLGATRYLKSRSFMLQAMKAAKKDLDARIRAEEKRQEWLKTCLLECFDAYGVTQFEAPDIVVKRAKTAPAVVILDEGQIPEEFVKVEIKRSAMKTEISKAIKSGIDVPGAKLESGFRLSIK